MPLRLSDGDAEHLDKTVPAPRWPPSHDPDHGPKSNPIKQPHVAAPHGMKGGVGGGQGPLNEVNLQLAFENALGHILHDWDATVTWTANSTDLDASHLNGSRLVLRSVDLSHSGQYTCYEGPSWHVKYRVNLRVGWSFCAALEVVRESVSAHKELVAHKCQRVELDCVPEEIQP
ncbi:hypothetical protein JRQ81_013069 [Phrynocephalus forsythii]|uniref:Ig-like domain-containing protein n=1 Tax=Phrynocephalus forsythii TaxID=171643 RepID=A0A9Q0Y1P2_9SAUR|nr:hypothetical protein JRQ81_013069 [Phrynocephalus forsythii]